VIFLHRNIEISFALGVKDFAGEVSDPYYLIQRAEHVRFFSKESQNGLEDTKNSRSAGRHGNQHVCLRRTQVTGSDNFFNL
jgi:hypothetical protein